jgi:tRNA (cmo5U34)-methyltransferase
MPHTHGHDPSLDSNAAIWQSAEVVQNWSAETEARERNRVAHRQFMVRLLPFDPAQPFTFLDLGAGTGAASRAILDAFSNSQAILADFSPQMMGEGERELAPFAGRYRYVEFDASTGDWPTELAAPVDAIITSLVVHHLSDDGKRALFAGIIEHLLPGGWYLNYDPVSTADPVVEATWQRVNDGIDPEAAAKRQHLSPSEQARFENHVRHISPLDPQLAWLRSAGFVGVDVYWKQLDHVIFGGCRPA